MYRGLDVVREGEKRWQDKPDEERREARHCRGRGVRAGMKKRVCGKGGEEVMDGMGKEGR